MYIENHPSRPEDAMNDNVNDYAPPEDWRADFEKQATKSMLERLHRVARARLAVYAGGKRENVNDADVEDVVVSALGDTWTGTLTWDRDRHSLYLHLKDAIKHRVRNGARLARKGRKHDEFDEDERGEVLAVAVGAVAPTMLAIDDRDETFASIVDHAIAALRPLAAGDVEVMALLDALAKRTVDRDDLLDETGMTVVEYNNAWRRIGSVVRQLPARLRDQALAALA